MNGREIYVAQKVKSISHSKSQTTKISLKLRGVISNQSVVIAQFREVFLKFHAFISCRTIHSDNYLISINVIDFRSSFNIFCKNLDNFLMAKTLSSNFYRPCKNFLKCRCVDLAILQLSTINRRHRYKIG